MINVKHDKVIHFKNKLELINRVQEILNKKDPIIISGGTTIKSILKDYRRKINSRKILLSDERLVNVNSKLRNDNFFKKLVKKKIIKLNQLIHYSLGEINKEEIKKLSNKTKEIKFHHSVLSLGNNGHFASIFDTYQNCENYSLITNSPKYPKKRVSISLKKISECKKIYFIASRKKRKYEIENFFQNKLLKNIDKKKIFLFTY
jgi:6-phosphogluconolactonase